MEFENPIVLPPLDDGESYRYCPIGAQTHRENPWNDIDRYELEVSLDGAHDGEISSLLEKLMAPTVAARADGVLRRCPAGVCEQTTCPAD